MIFTKEAIMKKAEEESILFVRLQFTDLTGIMKNLTIPIDQLEKALNNEIMFDGSSIDGFVRIEESDMYLRPDLNTFMIFPWDQNMGKVARLICDVYNSKGESFEGCPRNILKKVLKQADNMGYTMYVGPELEFFLFEVDEKGNPTLMTHDSAGYFDMAPNDMAEPARRDMVLALQQMGFEIEASHHECAPGQHEIDFRYEDALTAADNIMTFKLVVRVIAQKHGLHATFMPKPIYGEAGSGMHTNISLFKDGKNAFNDPEGKIGLSEEAYNFIGGLIKHARGMAALTNPTVNSYKRLVPGFEAPTHVAWSPKNRSPMMRIPDKRGISTRVELRNPDPSVNPYLSLAGNLAAGLDGIKNQIAAPEPVYENVYELTKAQRKEKGIVDLPNNLYDAIKELEKDELLMDMLGDHARKKYIAAKIEEWDAYRSQVSQWEIDRYLTSI
ncbi:type I glutamate--ammonia ligase [Acetobacterium bakii]|uniref:Glutamine synthetase n=1 Tax=Acetobacterium bakii TaxID=52689 RepID=A0A0L6TW99_9FIRM|nr:type I glutamate--ammonia ligase [Acetobacterium bakii]KNZ40538.1 glutamine synthetase [Acetobacterium bakii]